MPIRELPYQRDVCQLFAPFARARHAVLLDSGKPRQQQGRYDIFSAWPIAQLNINNNGIHYKDSDKNDHSLHDLHQLKQYLTQNRSAHKATLQSTAQDTQLPFCGGWLGFASYELGYLLENAAGKSTQLPKLPLFHAGYYNWAVIQDHQQQCAYLVYHDDIAPELLARIEQTLAGAADETSGHFHLLEPFRPGPDLSDYRHAFRRIEEYIANGDCYQVNYAMPFYARFAGDCFSAYRKLREAVPSPYMAYIQHGQQQLLSISPERFIAADGSRIHSKPIKGTVARSIDPAEDRQQAQSLLASDKNRAENVMIVDLIRNDFSRHSQANSVKVDKLCELESFANVHHLVSTVSATLDASSTIWDVFFDSFPGGSITGAPKIRAQQIINELEKVNREIYCGSIFMASDNGHFDSSICIRTLHSRQHTLTAWAGGGIVADSTLEDEYQECINKISALLAAL